MGKEKMRQSCTKSQPVRPQRRPSISLGPGQGRKGPGCVSPRSALTLVWCWTLAACLKILGLCSVLQGRGAQGGWARAPPGTEAMTETGLGPRREWEACESTAGMQTQEAEGHAGAQGGKEASEVGPRWKRKGWFRNGGPWVPVSSSLRITNR